MIYVDAVNGNNTTAETGSLSKPFLTILAALNAAQSGDTVYIRPGTYAEQNLPLSPGISLIGESYETVIIGEGINGADVIRTNTSDCFIDNITLYPDEDLGAGDGLNINNSSGHLNIGTIGIKGNGSTGDGIGIVKRGDGTVTFEAIHVLQGGLLDVVNILDGEFNSNLTNFPSSSGDVTNFVHLKGDGSSYPCAKISNLNISSSQVTSAIKSSGATSGYINKLTLLNPNVCGVTNALNVQGDYETIKSIGGEFVDVTYALSASVSGNGNDAIYSITSQHLPVYSYAPALAYNAEFAIDSLSQKSQLFKSSKNLFGVDQMSVGVAEKNIESYFGKGAPYQTGMVVFTTSGSAEKDIISSGFYGSTGSNITSVTTEAKSTGNSLFSFQSISGSDTILFCTQRRSDGTNNYEPLQTFGITADILDEAASNNYVLEVHGEYIEQTFGTASQWFEVPIQAYSNNLGYNYGNQIFQRNQSKETMIFGIDASVNWVTSSITPVSSSGVAIPPASRQPVTGLWARFRQVNDVATLSDVPSFESFRILSDSVAIGDKGIQFQGNSIYQDVLPLQIITGESTSDISVQTFGSNPSYTANVPDGGAAPGVSTPFTLPAGICTSYPIVIEYDAFGDTNSDKEITLRSSKHKVAFNLIPTGSNKIPQIRSINNANTFTDAQTITGSFIASASYESKIFKVTQEVDISDLFSGDVVMNKFSLTDADDVGLLGARAKFLRFALGEYRNPAQPFSKNTIPAPPITILEENWDNGSSGGTGVIDGWTLNRNVGSATTQAQTNQWRIASIGTPGDASSPVSQSLTNALYISDTTSTPTNNYSYEASDEVTCTAYCHFTPPAGIVNLQMEIHWKSRGENGYDFGTAFLALSGSADYTLEELDTREEEGTHPGGDIPTYTFSGAEGFALDGDLVIANIAGGSNGRLYDTNSNWNQTTLSIDSSLYDGTNAGQKHLLCFNWMNDFSGGIEATPTSIGYIKIIGSYT